MGEDHDLLASIKFCHERVESIAEKASDEITVKTYLIRLVKFIRDSVVVVRLTVPSEANAFRVFETLNDRGLDLSAVDLIKNYLFGIAYDSSEAVLKKIENRWSQLTHELTDVRESEFLRVYWTSRYGRTQLDDIFDEVRKRVKTSMQAEEMTEDLLEAAEHYTALDSSDDHVWSPYSARTKEKIRSLRILGAKQVRPVILAGIKRFSAEEFEKLVWLLEVVAVRWQIIGGGRTGAIEIGCARLAERVWSKEIARASDAREALTSIYTSDADFREAFIRKEGLTNQKTLYLLGMIEAEERQRRRQSQSKELEPSQALTVEHVLPKNPDEGWKGEVDSDAELVRDCSLRLGNTCLLTGTRNREAERFSFEKKKRIYAQSSLFSTQQIASYESWGRRSIEEHQKWLAARAVSIWRFQ